MLNNPFNEEIFMISNLNLPWNNLRSFHITYFITSYLGEEIHTQEEELKAQNKPENFVMLIYKILPVIYFIY